MKTLRSLVIGALVALPLAAVSAVDEGKTPAGVMYVSGGIGEAEQQKIKQMADKYSLQLVVSAQTGAYLADMQVMISSGKGDKVLDVPLNAPWLLVDLAPGTYDVAVTHAGKTEQRKVTIGANKPERVHVQFSLPGEKAK